MKLSELTDFFDLYVKKYLPFADETFYTTIIEYLVKYYYDKLYNVDPEMLKTVWEDQNIPYEIIDNLLISLGYPQKIINIFTIREKLLILNTLHDLYSYKASMDFIKKLNIFNDELNIYELYIDKLKTGEWVFKPKLIYKHEDVEELVNFRIPFQEVYSSIPSLLYSEEYLEQQYTSTGISLPIKSNILLLDYHDISTISLINDLVVSVFLKEYYEDTVGVYFFDKYYFSTLWKVYYLWYYIFSRYYALFNDIKSDKTMWYARPNNSVRKYVRMIYDPFKFSQLYIDGDTHYKTVEVYSNGSLVTQTVKDMKKLSDILDWYKSIGSREEFDNFYKEIFLNTNYNQVLKETDMSIDSLKFNYSILDPDIYLYIENRINGSPEPKSELFRILDEIYNSLVIFIERSQNLNIKNYGKNYFLKNLPQIVISPEDTKTYTMLYNFKPFHTELLTQSYIGLNIPPSDKFNRVFVDSEAKSFLFELLKASILDFSYEYAVFDIQIPKISDIFTLTSFFSNFSLKTIIQEIIQDISQKTEIMKDCSLSTISDDYEIFPP